MPEFAETRFFPLFFQEITKPEPESTALAVSPPAVIDPIQEIIRELEMRRNFAILCLTPDKIARAKAVDLVKIARELTALADEVRKSSRKIPAKERINAISDDVKTRIDKLIGGDSL